jgi:hypothetical protein
MPDGPPVLCLYSGLFTRHFQVRRGLWDAPRGFGWSTAIGQLDPNPEVGFQRGQAFWTSTHLAIAANENENQTRQRNIEKEASNVRRALSTWRRAGHRGGGSRCQQVQGSARCGGRQDRTLYLGRRASVQVHQAPRLRPLLRAPRARAHRCQDTCSAEGLGGSSIEATQKARQRTPFAWFLVASGVNP